MPMGRREQPTRQDEISAESQRRLREAAIRLFGEKGYRETSLQDIGEAAGISRGSITWHFRSKAGLLEAIVSEIVTRTLGMLDAVRDEDETPIGEWLALYLRLIRDDPASRLLPVLFLEAIRPNSEIQATYARFHRDVRTWITKRFTISQQRGEIDPAQDPGELATAVWGALVGVHLHWRLDPGVDPEAAMRSIETLLRYERSPARH
jgi:TetR/AcrR family transcriptional regulator, acrAB operon repressor